MTMGIDDRIIRTGSADSSFLLSSSDILHPGRANISKEELREKLGSLYKAVKDQISVFGLRTQFGGGKTTGFALVYDSPEAMKKFEPRYRLIRVGLATKIEKASRQQRAYIRYFCLPSGWRPRVYVAWNVERHCGHGIIQEPTADITLRLQASSARTARRRCGVLRRSRVPRRRRTKGRAISKTTTRYPVGVVCHPQRRRRPVCSYRHGSGPRGRETKKERETWGIQELGRKLSGPSSGRRPLVHYVHPRHWLFLHPLSYLARFLECRMGNIKLLFSEYEA